MNKQFLKMQKLAGLITESEYRKALLTEVKDISQEIQTLVDKNEFLKGKVKATPSDIIEGSKFVLLFSEDAAKHIVERHLDGTKPGSLFKSGVNLRDVAKKLLNIAPSEEEGGRVKWLGANGGNVGEMGVGKTSPEEVAKMKDYTMPDGQKEQVKIAPGKRKPTSEVNLITAELGTLSDGRKALSMITMFPGGTKIDGTEIPMNRGEFASKGLYFIVDSSSPLLKEIVNRVFTKYRRFLKENENIKDKVYDFLYSDEIQQDTGVTSFTVCDEDDWEKVKNYINGKGINGVTGKQSFLANNEDVTEQDFDKYYDEWLDYIEDQRADESRNQQDYNY